MNSELEPSVAMRLAMVYLANALAKEAVAANLHHIRKTPHLNERDQHLEDVIALCRASMARPKKRRYVRKAAFNPQDPNPKRRKE